MINFNKLKLTFPHTLCGITTSSTGLLLNMIGTSSTATAQCVRLIVSLPKRRCPFRLKTNTEKKLIETIVCLTVAYNIVYEKF